MNADYTSMYPVYLDDGDINRIKTAKKATAILIEDLRIAPEVDLEDLYIVWFCKTLQNWKALVSTDLVDTGIYFEVTYNGDDQEVYVDYWKKAFNRKIFLMEDEVDV